MAESRNEFAGVNAMRRRECHIRKYRLNDKDRLVAIWRSASALAHPFLDGAFMDREEIALRTQYLTAAEIWVCEVDGLAVGFVALIGEEIGGLFLEPVCHGRGLGRAMVDFTLALRGRLDVEVFERNAIGRRFYRRCGFVEMARSVHQDTGETVIRMVLAAS